MPPDRIENEDLLAFLGLKEREILGKLAELDGRTELEELRWLIRARASGHLKNLGDDAALPQVPEDVLSEYLHVKSLKLERDTSWSADAETQAQNRPKTK